MKRMLTILTILLVAPVGIRSAERPSPSAVFTPDTTESTVTQRCPQLSAAALNLEQAVGVHQSPWWMMAGGVDVAINGLMMLEDDTLFAYCRYDGQEKLIGAGLVGQCPPPELWPGFLCNWNMVMAFPIYGNDPYDIPAIDCPSAGERIYFRGNNRVPLVSNPPVTFIGFGTTVQLWSFSLWQSCCTLRGDVTGDGSIDVSDLLMLVDWMFDNGPAPACLENADLNGDFVTDISDMMILIGHMFSLPNAEPIVPCGSGMTR